MQNPSVLGRRLFDVSTIFTLVTADAFWFKQLVALGCQRDTTVHALLRRFESNITPLQTLHRIIVCIRSKHVIKGTQP